MPNQAKEHYDTPRHSHATILGATPHHVSRHNTKPLRRMPRCGMGHAAARHDTTSCGTPSPCQTKPRHATQHQATASYTKLWHATTSQGTTSYDTPRHDKLCQAAIRHATTNCPKLRYATPRQAVPSCDTPHHDKLHYAMPRQAVPSCDIPRHRHATILDAMLRHAMSCHAKLQPASFLLAGRLATMTHHCLLINRKERVECHK